MNARSMMMGGSQHIVSTVSPDPQPYRLRPAVEEGHFESVMQRQVETPREKVRETASRPQGEPVRPVNRPEQNQRDGIAATVDRPEKVLKKILKSLGLSEEAIEKIAAMQASGDLELEGLEGLEALVMLISAMPGFETLDETELSAYKAEVESLLSELKVQLEGFLEQPDLAPDHKVELEALLAQLTQAEKEVDTVDLQKQFHQVKKAFETQERPIKVEEHPEMAKTSEEKTDQVDRTQDTGSLAGDQQAKEPTAAQTPGEETGDGERGRDAQREAKITVVDRRTDDTSTGQQVNQDPAVKTTPVKANDLPLEQLVKQHKVFEQVKTGVMDQVVKGTVQLDDGSSEMTLRLKPAQLGEVHLKLSIEKGVVLAEMRVASEVVKQAIESQLADLKQSLSDKGFGVGGLNVSVNKDQTDGRGGQPRHQQMRRPIVLRPEKDTIPYDAFDYVEAGINAIDYLG